MACLYSFYLVDKSFTKLFMKYFSFHYEKLSTVVENIVDNFMRIEKLSKTK